MKKSIQVLSVVFLMFTAATVTSCGKNKCEECHYDLDGSEVEIGEYCGKDLKEIEKNGFTDAQGVKHDVHCGGH